MHNPKHADDDKARNPKRKLATRDLRDGGGAGYSRKLALNMELLAERVAEQERRSDANEAKLEALRAQVEEVARGNAPVRDEAGAPSGAGP